VAFEANPLNCEAFGNSPDLAQNRIEYLHMALAARDGTATFNIVSSEGKLVNGRGSLLVNTRRRYPVRRQAEVPCRRFDSFFSAKEAEGACLWIDVEGANREVLEGGGTVLPRAAMIFIEVEDRMKWQGQWLYPEVARHLAAHGHVLVARDFQSRVQHNVLFLRQNLAASPAVSAALDRYRREAAEGRVKH
jgi:FkbM family methyltransferase